MRSSNLFIEKDIDIFKYPNSFRELSDSVNQLTIGDLHGNVIKLLYFLVKEGVIDFSREDFDSLVNIYKKNDPNDLDKFEQIVNNIKVKKRPMIRLIGDVLADRGQNDYYTLFVLNKLKGLQLPIEVLLSNHDFEFIEPFEKKREYSSPNIGFYGQANSMDCMWKLIKDKYRSRQAIEGLVKSAYLPALKLVSYSLDASENTISIFSHAGIDIHTIKWIAKKMGVEFKDNSMLDLARTIDEINIKFMKKYVEKGKIHELVVDIQKASQAHSLIAEEDVITFIMWNRNYNGLKRDNKYKTYNVNYCHGHDPSGVTNEYIFNLDNTLGKNITFNVGEYSILASKHDLNIQFEAAKSEIYALISELENEVGRASFIRFFTDYHETKHIKLEALQSLKKVIEGGGDLMDLVQAAKACQKKEGVLYTTWPLKSRTAFLLNKIVEEYGNASPGPNKNNLKT